MSERSSAVKTGVTDSIVGKEANISTKNLKKSLGKKELFSVAIGQVIGAGIMALTGIAIALTGRSANLAFILSAIAVLFLNVPMIFVSSTIRLRGGQYSQAAIFNGKSFAGMFMIIFIVQNISIAMFAISFADYFFALVPQVPSGLVAFLILTIVFIINFFGVKQAAKFQGIMVIILVSALAMFAGFGVFQIQPGYFQNPGFITNGAKGLLTAMAMLTFATSGAQRVINLSAEAKNPKKDIPFVIIVSTLGIAIVYALMSTVAAGVLPVNEVAGKPLTVVAETILPQWLYVYFIIGGAMFALLTTLNAQVSWITKPVMQACVDNWFPKSFAKLHPKYNTPYILLIIFYFVGIIPILTGLDIEAIANSALLLNFLAALIMSFGLFKLPKMYSEQWKKSPFYVKRGLYNMFLIIAISVLALQSLLMLSNLNKVLLITNISVFIFALLFGIVRGKKVDMEISVDEN